MEPKENTNTSPQITTLKRNKDNNKTVAKTFKKILKPGEKKKKQKAIVIGALKQLVQYLESNCIELEGICRISGNSIQVKQLKKQLENGDIIDFSKLDSHVVSGTLKSFLRDSDEPLLTFDLYKNFLASIDIKDKNSKISFIKSLLSALPKDNYDLLQILLKFLYTIQLHSNINKMTSSNLAIVFSPTLLRPKEESLETMMADSNSISEVVKVLIEEFHVLYEIKQTILYQVSAVDLGIKEDKRSSSEQLEDAKVTIEQLKKHLDEEARERSILETYCTSMEQKLQELEDFNKSIIEEKESLGELLNEFRETNKNQSNETITLKTKVEYITDLHTKTESEKNELENIKLNLDKIIESNKIEIKSNNEQNQILKSNIKQLETNINKLNQDLNNKSNEFDKFKKETIESQKIESDKFDKFKKESIETQKLESDKFKLQIDQLTKDKLELNAHVERVQAEITLLLSSSNDKNSKKNSLKNQKKELDNSLKRNKEQESKINQLEKEKLKLSEELLKLQQQSKSSSSSNTSSSSSSSTSHKFVFGKKPNNKNAPTTTTTTTTTSTVVTTTPPPPIDEDDIISVKKFAFYYMNLAIKTDAMNSGLPCNINSAEILEELLAKNIKVQSWSEVISKKLRENK